MWPVGWWWCVAVREGVMIWCGVTAACGPHTLEEQAGRGWEARVVHRDPAITTALCVPAATEAMLADGIG